MHIFHLCLVVSLCLSAAPSRVFLMGGNVANNETQIYVKLAEATGKRATPNQCAQDWSITTCPKIAVITSAADTQSMGNDAYNVDEPGSLSYRSLFKAYGFAPRHVSVHVDNYQGATDLSTAQGQTNMEIIKNADILFFNGGDQARHARSWLRDDGTPNQMFSIVVSRANDNSAIISGTSAGSMIQSNPIYGGGISYGHLYFAARVGLAPKKVSDGGVNGTGLADSRNGTRGLQYQDNGGIMPGFGFVPFLADTHFDARGRLGRIVPALVQIRFTYGVGIDESTAFFYDRGVATAYGKNGVFIVDTSKATLSSKSYFAANNLFVHYLTSGDAFDFASNRVTAHPSKLLITKPKYTNFTDSSDILSSYETTKLLTRVVDQTPGFNVGKSRIPSGYPSSAPYFTMTFQRTTYTQGYYASVSGKYTVANATVIYAYE